MSGNGRHMVAAVPGHQSVGALPYGAKRERSTDPWLHHRRRRRELVAQWTRPAGSCPAALWPDHRLN